MKVNEVTSAFTPTLHLRYICVASALHLRYICVTSALHLRYICVASALHLRCICVTSRGVRRGHYTCSHGAGQNS